ncbi:MAG TPA: hypothetical protein VJS30_24040 [Paraburkholderia sp.]|nr:hypothetical protein [Paraburkholderia sp.]
MKGCPKSLGHDIDIDIDAERLPRHRDFTRLMPLGVFVAVIALAGISS